MTNYQLEHVLLFIGLAVATILFWLYRHQQADIRRIRASEQQLSEACQVAHLAYWNMNLLTGTAWWSDEIFAMFGLDKNKVQPSHEAFLKMIHPADHEGFQKKFQSILRNGSGDALFRIVGPTGEERYIHGYASVVYDQNHKPIVMRGTNQDVTESQLTRRALQERESEVSAIYSNVAGILFFIGVEPGERFRFISVNKAFLETTGLQESQIAGKLVEKVIPPESIDLVLAKYKEAVWSKKTVRWEESSHYPTGEKIGDVAVTPIFGSDGTVTHLSGIVHDITERRRLENELREAINVRDEFLSIASHELKTPLSALHMQLQLLLRIGNPQEATLIKAAFESTKLLVNLLNDLLDVTRIRAGKLVLNPRQMDLREAVLEGVARAQESAQQKGSSISLHAEGPITGKWDPTRVEQILSNLLSNAIKYGEGRPIEVTVGADQGRGVVRIEVNDRGIGISHDMQFKIFERFQRAISGDKITGLGLGLYIVHEIVAAHGGSITVQSEPNKGATFTVELPLVAA